jgi:O-antigen ligase
VGESLRRLPLARATQAALAATILCTLLGSSSVADITPIGVKLRWVALFAFAGCAVLWALSERERRRPTAAHVVSAALCMFALVSATWSVAPWLTLGRAVSLCVAVTAAGAVGFAIRGMPERAAAVAEAIVAAALVAVLAGAVVYAVDPAVGAQSAVVYTPFRLRGLGESPNTVPMLAAVAVPLALWLAWARRGGRRGAYVLAALVFAAEIIASGSRSAVGGVCAALLVFAASAPVARRRRRATLLAASLLAGAALVGGVVAMVALTALPAPAPQSSPTPLSKPAPLPRPILPSLEDELGGIPSGPRTLFGNDGRSQALSEAIDQAGQRPALGWGFGTEERVFVDRLAQFHAARPENSYVGLYLQLGALGVALFLALAAVLVEATVKARSAAPSVRIAVAGCAAAVAAGYGLAVGQSFVYSVGNVATVSVWCAAFLLAGLASASWGRRSLAAAAIVGTAVLVLAAVLGRVEKAHAQNVQRAGIERAWQEVGRTLDAPRLDGFRLRSPGRSCLLYEKGGMPAGVELCFDGGRLVQAIDRSGRRFRAWNVEPFGASSAAIRIQPRAVERTLRRLGAYGPGIAYGAGYLARPPRG